MAQAIESRKKSKSRAVKIVTIILSVIVAVAIIAAVFITVTTLPKDENDENVIYVGGMVTSENIDFQSENAKGLEKNPVLKIMQMIWRFCDGGDKKKHAAQTPPENITQLEDIAYIDDGNHYHLLDVMYPDGTKPNDKLPVIIDFHGGGWMYADKDLNDYYAMALASRGYVVFNVSYRLVPDVTVNEQLQDCSDALRWISSNMSDYPCDASKIILTGDSAGGQLAAYSAVLSQSEELRSIFDTVDPQINISSLLLTSPAAYMKDSGFMSIYSSKCWGKNYKSSTLYNYMNLDEIIDFADNMPPTYFITSSGDSLANSQTHMAYDLFKNKGIECDIVDISKDEYNKSLPHVFSVLFPFEDYSVNTIDKALEFCNR